VYHLEIARVATEPTTAEPSLPPLTSPLLAGKTVLITGGAGGIGRVTAKLFAQQGARVAVLDNAANTKPFAGELGAQHLGLVADVSERSACETALATALATFGKLDILVTMAGPVNPGKITEITPADYDLMVDTHLRGTFNMCQLAVESFRRQGAGVIVCMSSIAAQRGGGLRGGPHYAAAKAGVLGLMKAMARELAPENIRVNAVCPGAIFTGRRPYAEMNAMFAGNAIPMGRVGLAEEVARVFLFLASDLATYVTGATIDVNGGMHIN
jgi:NAD(P)-dependent dehydrogenase (short-subunit alcohol dehydrogenase family)